MSDNTAAPSVPAKKPRTKLILAILAVLVLLLIYGAGIIVLPVAIMSNFYGRNCDTVLALHNLYAGLYPGFARDQTLLVSVSECNTYSLAAMNEAEGRWREAYDAYRAYSETYPNGLFAGEAHERGARVLMNLIQDQIRQEQYRDALAGLEVLVSDFSDTDSSAEAWTLIPSTYVTWGSGLRDEGQFEQAEQVFYRFRLWSQNHQKAELQKDAQRELAQTYLDWGVSFQSQHQYENALAKFDQALAADPNSEFASTPEAIAGKSSVYVDWGNELLDQIQLLAAMEKFEQAVSLAEGGQDRAARTALTNGHLHWAADLSANEDFFAALDHLEIAKTHAMTEAMEQAVDAALQETYLAFSKSTGQQARQVIAETLAGICKENDPPEYPIFGLNEDSVRVGLFGVEEPLPADLAARTPGEMHYIACAQVERRVLERDGRYVWVKKPAGIFAVALDEVRRIQVFWTITVRDVKTGEVIGTKTFEGGPPPPFPKGGATGGGDLEGAPPTQDALRKWLLSVIP